MKYLRRYFTPVVWLLSWLLVFVVLAILISVDVFAKPAKVPTPAELAANTTIAYWILGGVACLMIIKGGLEFFGIIPAANHKEIKEIKAQVNTIHTQVTGPIAEVCRVETGKVPPSWCVAHDAVQRSSDADILALQNSEMVVRLLGEVLDRQKVIEAAIKDLRCDND